MLNSVSDIREQCSQCAETNQIGIRAMIHKSYKPFLQSIEVHLFTIGTYHRRKSILGLLVKIVPTYSKMRNNIILHHCCLSFIFTTANFLFLSHLITCKRVLKIIEKSFAESCFQNLDPIFLNCAFSVCQSFYFQENGVYFMALINFNTY